MAGFAAWQAADPATAETRYLALLAGALLLCLGGLAGAARVGRRLVAVVSTLAVLAVWALPPGPTRGATVVALLVAGLALAFAERSAAARTGAATLSEPAGPWRFAEALSVLLPAAIALQVLARSDRLLALELTPRLAAGLLGLPLVAAAAAAALAARRGRDAALLAAASAVLVSGAGIAAGAAGGLAAVALADAGWGWRRARRGAAAEEGADPRVGRRRETIAWLALAGVVASVALRDPWAAAVAAGAAALLAPSVPVRLLAGAAALGAALVGPGAGWEAAGERAALALLVLPALVWAALPPRSARRVLTETLPAAALLAAAARCGASPAAMAAPLALLVLLVARPAPDEPAADPGPDPALAPQRVWSGALVALAALVGAFPWLRASPVVDALGLFGLRLGVGEVAVVVAATVVLGLAARRAAGGRETADRRPAPVRPQAPTGSAAIPDAGPAAALGRAATWVSGTTGGSARPAAGTARPAAWTARPAVWTAGLLAIAAAAAVPPGPATPLLAGGEVLLDASRPELVVALDGTAGGAGPPVGSVVIDSNLSHAALLPDRQPVATVRLLDGDGRAEEWTLVAGRDTAEWAARRPDVAAGMAHEPPPAWLASVAPEGGFFGQVYRSRRRTERQLAPSRLEVRLAPGLPPETVFHLYRVEARP